MIAVRPDDEIALILNASDTNRIGAAVNLTDSRGVRYSINASAIATADRAGVVDRKKISSSGYVESVCLTDQGGASTPTQPGQLYCQVLLVRDGMNIATLLGGYFYGGHAPSYPGIIEGPEEGPGRVYTASGADAAAGAEVADTVPTGAQWRLIAAEVVLVTDASVADRFTSLVIDNAGSPVTRRLFLTGQTAQTASLTRTHHWSPGTDANNTAEITQVDTVTLLAKFPMSLPVEDLRPGDNIRTITAPTVNGASAMDTGDNYGVARYLVMEWLVI